MRTGRVTLRSFAAVLTAVAMLATATSAGATLPVTTSRPYQAVCEAQGGTFSMSVDFVDLYCDKEGPLFTAFTEEQLRVQRRLCRQVYGAFFGVQGFIRPDGVTGTGTFCATSALASRPARSCPGGSEWAVGFMRGQGVEDLDEPADDGNGDEEEVGERCHVPTGCGRLSECVRAAVERLRESGGTTGSHVAARDEMRVQLGRRD